MEDDDMDLTGKRILLVEDDLNTLRLLAARLASWGFETFEATDGEQAIEIAQEKKPDLILLDTILPNMKGREVCIQLKQNQQTKHIPVIFLTALELADHVKAGMDLGAEDYITKPINPEDLKRRIRVCLIRHDSSAQS